MCIFVAHCIRRCLKCLSTCNTVLLFVPLDLGERLRSKRVASMGSRLLTDNLVLISQECSLVDRMTVPLWSPLHTPTKLLALSLKKVIRSRSNQT
jgi:hypothetical protein